MIRKLEEGHLTPINRFRPELPGDLCEMIHQSLSNNPDDRIQTAREWAAILKYYEK
jgi:hypothetical protein